MPWIGMLLDPLFIEPPSLKFHAVALYSRGFLAAQLRSGD